MPNRSHLPITLSWLNNRLPQCSIHESLL